MTVSVLFVSYNGLLEPVGRSQVLPYLEGLARAGYRLELLSFEKGPPGDTLSMKPRLEQNGIRWDARRYHRQPKVISTLFDIAVGLRHALWRIRAGVRLLHARSDVPAVIAELCRRATGTPYIFDHRGLQADEYADAGIWPKGGVLYRGVRRAERLLLASASGVVVLTDRYASELALGDRCVTIPCAVDLNRFVPREAGAPDYDLVYAGSWSGLYLSSEIIRFFESYRRRCPKARMLLLIPPAGEAPQGQAGIDVQQADPFHVPELLARAKVGLSFRRGGETQKAASPIKVGEYLATGLPVVSSAGVGDLDDLLESTQTGIIVRDNSRGALEDAAGRLVRLMQDGDLARRCRKVAEDRFNLEQAIATYGRLYDFVLRHAAAQH